MDQNVQQHFQNHFQKRKFIKKLQRKRKRQKVAQTLAQAFEKSEDEFEIQKAEEDRRQREEEWMREDRALHEAWLKEHVYRQPAMPPSMDKSLAVKDLVTSSSQPVAHSSVPNESTPVVTPSLDSLVVRPLCHFFTLTGVCRFNFRCSRQHVLCPTSNTLVFPNMFVSFNLEEDSRTKSLVPESSLEIEESDIISEFSDFYWDVWNEFRQFGDVQCLRTCRNAAAHLRGNVYVQFRRVEEAENVFMKFQGRYYAGSQLQCHFVKVDHWSKTICGLFHRDRCPRGGQCNFLHVFLNPGETPRSFLRWLHSSAALVSRNDVDQVNGRVETLSTRSGVTETPARGWDDEEARVVGRRHSRWSSSDEEEEENDVNVSQKPRKSVEKSRKPKERESSREIRRRRRSSSHSSRESENRVHKKRKKNRRHSHKHTKKHKR